VATTNGHPEYPEFHAANVYHKTSRQGDSEISSKLAINEYLKDTYAKVMMLRAHKVPRML
jgi:hypothetical protein